jgi:hypothetical protein
MPEHPPIDPNSFRYKFGRWWAQQSPTKRLIYYGVVFVFVIGSLTILNRLPRWQYRRPGPTSPPAIKAVPRIGDVQPRQEVLSNIKRISKQELGKDYPFTVSEGELTCRNSLVLFTADGQTYAVNGTARTSKRFKPIDEIWAEDPTIKGAKIDTGKVIEIGLELCR